MLVAAALAAASVSGAGRAAQALPTTEVIVTLKAPALTAFGRSLTSARHHVYARELAAAQAQAARNLLTAAPGARIRWRYRLVANGFAVVLPTGELPQLAHVPGVARVWPNVTYHSLSTHVVNSPALIGADKIWGPTLATAGSGMKIGIIDDGIDATHPYFSPTGLTYPPGFPKGRTDLLHRR